jgi:hypothetical protein
MADDSQLPLRPSSDPGTLRAQLLKALNDLPSEGGDGYQGYLAQVVRSCFLAIQDGDLDAPQASIDLLAPAFHLGERFAASPGEVEATTWLRATSKFFEVGREALAPRFTLETFLARERSETEREVLRILLHADQAPLRRGEVVNRWAATHEAPTAVRIGQVLVNLHEVGLVVRVKQRAQGGNDVAFYRLSRLGRELCERLHLGRVATPDGLWTRDLFYTQLNTALRADTSEPLYLTTFVEPAGTGTGGAHDFHEGFLAALPSLRRPIYWIVTSSPYIEDRFLPAIAAARAPVALHLYKSSEANVPTVQVFGNGGCVYPIVERAALPTTQAAALETWRRHESAAQPIACA